ncbi:MAG: MFS transporter [Gammaproteobacteria bacterium]|nr:MFS transporter [Gammaproteobacteria bacterium]
MTGPTADAVAGATPAPAPLYRSWYPNYVLGVLFLAYVVNVMDRAVLGVLIQPIKHEFGVSDTALGLLGGIAFALFYATLGIPIAAWADRSSRRNVLALAIALWSTMTALCGVAVNFIMLLLARIGTAVGEAGGTPPSHSLISDYFPLRKRATALSFYALGIPIGAMCGSLAGGWLNEFFGWRAAFVIVGLPGVAVALLVRFTVQEPPRGLSDAAAPAVASTGAPPILDVFKYLWARTSFRHITLAAALHSFVWYGGSTWNAPFFIRSHGMSTGEAGSWLAFLALVATIGTFFGGVIADKLSTFMKDRRWYMRVPGIATLAMVPFQFSSYLASDLSVVIPSFCIMMILASIFFGPSFAMTQALATLRMRAVAASILLFVQTLIGLGLGPFFVGVISDVLQPSLGAESLAYGLVIVGLVNIWAAAHYFHAARTLREDLDATAAMVSAGK